MNANSPCVDIELLGRGGVYVACMSPAELTAVEVAVAVETLTAVRLRPFTCGGSVASRLLPNRDADAAQAGAVTMAGAKSHI
jgi:hypothetical protein